MKKVLFVIAAVLLFTSCISNELIFDKTFYFEENVWNRFDIIEFNPHLKKTGKYYDIVLKISYENGFQYENLPINTVLKFPDGQVNVFRTVVGIKGADGSYQGSVFGDTWTVEKDIHTHKRLDKSGIYSLSVQQLTQYFNLEGLVSVQCIVRLSKNQ